MAKFAGYYAGDWVSLTDATDAGPCTWTIGSDGTIEGTDNDPVRGLVFTVRGRIDKDGNVTTMSTPDNGDPAASLNGRLQFRADGTLSGVLEWGVAPPLSYTYTFARTDPPRP
ncbi:MAG: hypothetical protein AMXMBFR81_13090 [Chthonomonas sp.]